MATEDEEYEKSLQYGFEQLMSEIVAKPALCVSKALEIWKDLQRVAWHLFAPPADDELCYPRFGTEEHAARWDVFCLSTGSVDSKLTTRTGLLHDAIQTAKDTGAVIPFDPAVLKQVQQLLKRIRDCKPLRRDELHGPIEAVAHEMDRVERGLRVIRKRQNSRPAEPTTPKALSDVLVAKEPERYQFGLYVANLEAMLIGRDVPNFRSSRARFTDALWDLCLILIKSDEKGVSREAAENVAGVRKKTFNTYVGRVRDSLRYTLGVTVELKDNDSRYYLAEHVEDS